MRRSHKGRAAHLHLGVAPIERMDDPAGEGIATTSAHLAEISHCVPVMQESGQVELVAQLQLRLEPKALCAERALDRSAADLQCMLVYGEDE